jgi:hypothetical protein
MIKIRYRDPNELSPGLHAAAEGHGRRTTVYLLSGLTAAERRRALRRLRLNARMGYCPRLPASQLALALLADQFRTGLARAGAVFRLHPAGSTLPVMFISGGAIAFLLFSTVSIHVLHPPRNSEPLPAPGPAPAASADAVPFPGASQGAGLGRLGVGSDTGEVIAAQSPSGAAGANPVGLSGLGTGGTTPAGTSSQPGTSTTDPATSITPQGSTATEPSGTQTSSGQSSSQTSSGQTSSGQSSSQGSGQTSSQGSGQTSSQTSSQSTSASSGPSSSSSSGSSSTSSGTSSGGSGGGVCLDVGPLGICLNV